jgi:hypothetical protein
MKKERHFLLFLMILIISSCQTPNDYFNRPVIIPTINNECTGFQDGQLIDTTNFISVSPEDYDILQQYYEDKEYRLYRCLKYGRCR